VTFNIILVGFLGVKIFLLNTALEKMPPPAKIFSDVNVKEIYRPVAIKSFEFPKIFDTKDSADNQVDTSRPVSNPKGLNQIFDDDLILRLKGIIISRKLSFAVFTTVKKKETETIKLLKGEHVRGYLLEEIFKNHVELSKNGKKNVVLRIFRPDQN